MNNMRNLHAKVHSWLNTVGFSLNASQTNPRSKVITNHYFFETFNLVEKQREGDDKNAKFLCFDMYGEKINVRTLLDLQSAFFENISQLK